MIPYGRQDIDQTDIDSVLEVLRSDFLTQGPAVPEFEGELVIRARAKHAVAVNSATSALHIACMALGVKQGDWVWTSPITFVASANCALYCGARIDFVDIDPRTYNLSVERLAEKLEKAGKENRLPKVVIPVHLCGQPCEMAEIRELSRRYGFKVLEDASHAIGASYREGPVGDCRYSDVTVFSFHPVKIVTTAEGGAALTNDDAIARRMELLRSHGITRNPDEMSREPDGPWYYEQTALGYNYRMTDLQAALGKSQMHRLDQFVSRRREIAGRYDRALADLPIVLPWQHPDGSSARHLYVIRLKPGETAVSQRAAFEAMRTMGIGVNLHYIPVYRQPYFASMGFAPETFPFAEQYYAEAMSLPLYSGLDRDMQDRVVDSLSTVLLKGVAAANRVSQ